MMLILLAALLLALLAAILGANWALPLAAGLAAIALASLPSGTAPLPGTSVHHVDAHLCWLKAAVTLHVEKSDNVYRVALDLSLQRPNPCYQVKAVTVQAKGADILIEIQGASPPPGTLCIQVVPPPLKVHREVTVVEPPASVTLRLWDETSGAACNTHTKLHRG